MRPADVPEELRKLEIPGLVSFSQGGGGLVKAGVSARSSQSEIYLHGAQVTAFQERGNPPLLFLSRLSHFQPGKPIRGGVPICFPWFGPRPGDVSHGFARVTDWELTGASPLPNGGAIARLRLPINAVRPGWPRFTAEFTVQIAGRLRLELAVTNQAEDCDFEFEACLHTYFHVGDVRQVRIRGLESVPYVDHMRGGAVGTDAEPVQITAQTDRTYLDTSSPVEIQDPVLGRIIRVDKAGSRSTVIWNPWTTQPLADFGPEEYLRMVCVESGNVGRNRVKLAPGETSRLEVTLSSSQGSTG